MGTPFAIKEGAPLCPVGNAGFSTGPHVHWEIHPSSEVLSSYTDRLDPEVLLKGASHA
jgi:murein DD-endopeptidase MepM/ murein hydrolase activator NlpD